MKQLKTTLQRKALNPDNLRERIEAVNRRQSRRFGIFPRLILPLGFALSLILALAVGLNRLPEKESVTLKTVGSEATVAYAMVSVDINPSFEIYLNKPGKVIEIKALNEDAQTIGTEDLLGKEPESVIEQLIARATAAGFIVPADVQEDYVLISTVILDDDDPEAEKNQDSLGAKIQAALLASETIDGTIEVAIIKATLREKFEAEAKDVPLGLYVINGLIDNGSGEMIKVSEFVKNKDNHDKLGKRASITVRNQKKFIQNLINELGKLGVDVTGYQTRLDAEGTDLEALKAEVKERLQALNPEPETEESASPSGLSGKPDGKPSPGQDRKN